MEASVPIWPGSTILNSTGKIRIIPHQAFCSGPCSRLLQLLGQLLFRPVEGGHPPPAAKHVRDGRLLCGHAKQCNGGRSD